MPILLQQICNLTAVLSIKNSNQPQRRVKTDCNKYLPTVLKKNMFLLDELQSTFARTNSC